MKRDQRLDQELLVLVLERQREAIDDTPQDLEQLRDTVVILVLVPARTRACDTRARA